jgi:hypothetical protein
MIESLRLSTGLGNATHEIGTLRFVDHDHDGGVLRTRATGFLRRRNIRLAD